MLLTILTLEMEAVTQAKHLQALLERVAHGDREAFAAIYEHARTPVYALMLSYVKNVHDAEDITEDAFVRIWEAAPSYRKSGSAMAWMLTVARNLALMHLRRNKKFSELEEYEWNAIPAGETLATEDKMVLSDALAKLSDEERRILLLHASSGMKHREIASLLELPLSTVLSKYHRALKKAERFMKGENTQ